MPLLPPSDADLDRIANQWVVADQLAGEHLGERLDQSLGDLDRLQRLVDLGLFSDEHTYQLQCLGVALGRVLATNVPGLDWAVISDEYGNDPTIRYLDTSLQINVLTIISKRVEARQQVDVRALYDWARGQVDTLKTEVD